MQKKCWCTFVFEVAIGVGLVLFLASHGVCKKIVQLWKFFAEKISASNGNFPTVLVRSEIAQFGRIRIPLFDASSTN